MRISAIIIIISACPIFFKNLFFISPFLVYNLTKANPNIALAYEYARKISLKTTSFNNNEKQKNFKKFRGNK